MGLDFSLAERLRDEAEVFDLDGLAKWSLQDELISDIVKSVSDPGQMQSRLSHQLKRMAAQGRLGMGSTEALLHKLVLEPLCDLHKRYHKALARWPIESLVRIPVSYVWIVASSGGNETEIIVEDTISDFRENAEGQLCRLVLMSSTLIKNPGKSNATYQYKVMMNAWVIHVAAHLPGSVAASTGMTTQLVSKAGSVIFKPLSPARAETCFRYMLTAWSQGVTKPLPLSLSAGFAAIKGEEQGGLVPRLQLDEAELAYAKELEYDPGYLQRAFADFEVMTGDPFFAQLVAELYFPLWQSVKEVDA